MTVQAISRQAVRALPKVNQAMLLLLAEEGKVSIIDDEGADKFDHEIKMVVD